MTTEMPRSSDARWYEPPPPRDWKINASALQRIESAANLRKNLLESATKSIVGVPIRRNFQAVESKEMSRSFDNDISRSLASLPSTPRGLRSPLAGSAKDDLEGDSMVQPNFSRQMSASTKESLVDLSSTYVFRSRVKPQDKVENILVNTPPSRPRSSSMTKYEPLPAIKHSASSVRRRPMDTNNNNSSTSSTSSSSSNEVNTPPPPPPLIRSKTFDVIETNLSHLTVVEDEYDYTSFSDSSEEEDDVSDSDAASASETTASSPPPPPHPSDPEFAGGITGASGVVSASSCNLALDSRGSENSGPWSSREDSQGAANRREGLFDSGLISSAIPVQTVIVTIEGKLLSEYVSQVRMGALKSRPCTQYGRKPTGTEIPTPSTSRTFPEGPNNDDEHIVNTYDGMEEDIIVYIKMPDDTLMLASSPRTRTLGELLSIVKGTNINGRCVVISRKGLRVSDLSKSLYELGISDNTTLHLIDEWADDKQVSNSSVGS